MGGNRPTEEVRRYEKYGGGAPTREEAMAAAEAVAWEHARKQ